MTNPLPRPEEKTKPRLLPAASQPSPAELIGDWKAELGAHWHWWLHRRRLQWRQAVAAVLITATALGLWLLLVETLD